MPTFGECVKALRKSRKLKQVELAEALGVTERTIRNYESGEREPDLPQAAKLADFFNVSMDYLMGRTDDSNLVLTREAHEAQREKENRPIAPTHDNLIPPEEREFLEWVKNNVEGTFFYDFSKAPEEQKADMMKSLRIVWELEKNRKPGQKQGD